MTAANPKAVAEAVERIRAKLNKREFPLYEVTRVVLTADLETLLTAIAAKDEALTGYRAASHWIGADSWDGCSDCMDVLRMACAADPDRFMTPNEIAGAMKSLRAQAGRATLTETEHGQ